MTGRPGGRLLIALYFVTAASILTVALLFLPKLFQGERGTLLSQEELAWLDEHGDSLVLYYNTDFPPVEFASPEGSFTGLGADVIAAVEQRLGITFVKQPCDDWNRHLQALADGECAVAPTIVRTVERERFAYFTEPYARVPVVIITSRARQGRLTLDDLAGNRVAVVSGFASEEYVRSHSRGLFEVRALWNVPEGLRAVAFGEADAFVENLAVAAYYADQEGLSNLRVAGTTDYFFEWSIGISREYPLLFSSVQKALSDISDRELEALQKRWISMEMHEGLSPEAMQTLKLVALFTAVLLVCLTAVSLLLKRRLMEKVASLELAQQELLDQSQRLQHAEKMEALGTLSGGIAHDFNNILQVIGGYAQLLLARRSEDDPDHRELAQILGASRRAAALISQLLAFSRNMESRKTSLNLNHEVTNAAQILQQTIPRMIEISLELDPELRLVQADPVHMEQLILNLAGNSVDAMPSGGKLFFRTANTILDESACHELEDLKPGPFVMLSVTDTGCGIPPEMIDKVFNPFFTTKEPGRGTGLGLASVYGIVKNHGGGVLCRSTVGEGTTFKVFLPVVTGEKAPAAAEEPRSGVLPRGSETILVVDDEPDILRQTVELLSACGYRVITADTGEMALDVFFKTGGIDLVILDLNMPGMGGYHCMRELQRMKPGTRILIVSGHSAFGRNGEDMASMAAGFIGKPYKMAELAARVREVLEG